MNKVKLTQEQAEVIEKSFNYNWTMENIIRSHIWGWASSTRECLNDLSLDELIRALYIGYEVEKEFKVGDWVKSKLGKGIGKIIDINDIGYWTDFGLVVPKEDDLIRHATDEEIQQEKQRRLDEKLDKILLKLTDYERERLIVKLAGGNE